MSNITYDLAVIGAGPGGYVAAIRAAQLGWRVACIEKERALGGTCLRIGCIPSKALLESSERFMQVKNESAPHGIQIENVKLDLAAMMSRKDKIVKTLTGGVEHLFKKNNVTRFLGAARVENPQTVIVQNSEKTEPLQTRHILIATGSKPAQLKDISFDGDRIGASTEALSYSKVPEHLIVIGAGYIGLELGSVWRRLGSKVTVLEYLDRILPGMDWELAREAQKAFKKQGLDFKLGARISRIEKQNDFCTVHCEGMEPLKAERVLVAAGRVPNTEGLWLDSVGVKLDERGRIEVDEHFATSVNGIFAIGDVIRGPMLAHKAEEEGIACVERLITGYGYVNYDAIPGVVYTEPEIASVGKTEDELKEAGIEFRKGVFPFRANGRALCLGEPEGFVKMLADSKTDRILGVHVIGPRAGDMIAEAAAAIEFCASSEDVARTSHAHPTLAEAMKEAALAVDGRTINF